MKFSRDQIVIIVVTVVAVAAFLIYHELRRQRIEAEYGLAIYMCEEDAESGARAVERLERRYGEDSAPSDMAVKAALCKLSASVGRYQDAVEALQ